MLRSSTVRVVELIVVVVPETVRLPPIVALPPLSTTNLLTPSTDALIRAEPPPDCVSVTATFRPSRELALFQVGFTLKVPSIARSEDTLCFLSTVIAPVAGETAVPGIVYVKELFALSTAVTTNVPL